MGDPSIAFLFSITPPTAVEGTTEPTTIEMSGFKDLALDLATWDLRLDEVNGAKYVVLVTGADAIAQRLAIRFKFWLGEWFLDTRQGVPYIERILVANPDLSLIRTIFRKVIVTTPGVKKVDDLEMTIDKSARRLVVSSFRATLVDGSTLTLEAPFIVFAKD